MRPFACFFFALILAACGDSNSYETSEKRLIDDCVQEGRSMAACECQIEFAERYLSSKDYSAMIEATDARRRNMPPDQIAAQMGMTGQELIELSKRLMALDKPAARYCASKR